MFSAFATWFKKRPPNWLWGDRPCRAARLPPGRPPLTGPGRKHGPARGPRWGRGDPSPPARAKQAVCGQVDLIYWQLKYTSVVRNKDKKSTRKEHHDKNHSPPPPAFSQARFRSGHPPVYPGQHRGVWAQGLVVSPFQLVSAAPSSSHSSPVPVWVPATGCSPSGEPAPAPSSLSAALRVSALVQWHLGVCGAVSCSSLLGSAFRPFLACPSRGATSCLAWDSRWPLLRPLLPAPWHPHLVQPGKRRALLSPFWYTQNNAVCSPEVCSCRR